MNQPDKHNNGRAQARQASPQGIAAAPRAGFQVEPLTFLILLNGILVAAAAFFLLYFTMSGVRVEDSRNLVRDVVQSTELAVREAEKAVGSLGFFYASEMQDSRTDVFTAQRMRRLLLSGGQFTTILWVTDKGKWRHEDVVHNRMTDKFSADLGLPSAQELLQEMSRYEYNQVRFLKRLPYPAFEQMMERHSSQIPMIFGIKMRTLSGGSGVLLAITTADKALNAGWGHRRDEIRRITISERTSGDVLIDRQLDVIAVTRGETAGENVRHALHMGGIVWDMDIEIKPSLTTRFLRIAPWGIGGLIALVTLVLAFVTERKFRQDKKLAEMSKTLEGTHTELQSRISERDKLFHTLRRSEREYRAVINSVSDVIFETDESGKILFLNETWKRTTQKDITEGIGQNLFQMLSPDDQDTQRAMFEELVRGERQSYRAETLLNVGGDTFKPIEIAFSMLRMADDKTVRVVGTITDIEKRRRAELAVREAEMRFRAIVENSISGIYQTSPEGKFLSANKALAEILGYNTAEELMFAVNDIGKQIYVHPEQREEFVQKLLFEGRITGLETEVYRRDGKKIWIMENARVVRSDRGGVAYYEGSVWDVTERRIAEEATKEARIQAEISSRSRMEFLANMSHELRTPLNAVIGFSEIIKDEVMGPVSPPSYREYARDIYDSGNHLLQIISEILEVSKIETGNRELNRSNFHLSRAIKACRTIMMSRIEQSGVHLKVDLPEDLPEILGEELGFKQILLNLIGNAIKFTPADGHVVVTARVVEDTDEMQIDITDDGIGMTAEEVKKALTPFGKVDNNFSTMKEGTGLGLTIVESLVGLHGGRFELISEKGKGTTARVILPPSCVLRPDGTTADKPAVGNVVKMSKA